MGNRTEMNKGIPITGLIIIALLFGTLYIWPDSFEIILNNGNHLVKYNKGILKLYSGRYKALQDEVSVECYYGRAYHKVYKARGTKYSNLSYYKDDYHHIFQDIYFSRGNVTRESIISDFGIKETFYWTPKNPDERCRLRIKYSSLEENKGILIFSKTQKLYGIDTDIGFNLTLDWNKDNEKISMVKRYDNGNLHILTSPFTGNFSYDPEILINEKLETVTEFCNPVYDSWTDEIPHYKTCKGEIYPNGTIDKDYICLDYTEKIPHVNEQVDCKKTGKVNVSGKIYEGTDSFCKLFGKQVCCAHNKVGGQYAAFWRIDGSVTMYCKDLITEKETFNNFGITSISEVIKREK